MLQQALGLKNPKRGSEGVTGNTERLCDWDLTKLCTRRYLAIQQILPERVGGLLSVILSMHIGFQRSLLVALGFYGLAVGAFYAVKRASIQHVDGARQPDAEVELRQTT